jgi:phage major head subunit gpT-like protein
MQTYNPTLTGRALRTLFLQSMHGFEGMDLVAKIATLIKSDGASETYPWIGDVPMMTEQVDDTVKFTPMSDASYTITNKTWTAGIAVRRQDLEDDQVGAIRMKINQLALAAVQHKNKLLTYALTNGTTGTGYDANAFFSDTHPARGSSGVQDNLAGGSGTTTAQVQADINSVLATMMNFLAENGEPFQEGPSKFIIAAPPALRKPILEALNISEYPDRTQAQLGGMSIEPLFLPRLTATDANDWYFLHVGGSEKPLIFQDREPVTFESTEEGSGGSIMREQYYYKVRARYNVGYGPWQHAIKVVN